MDCRDGIQSTSRDFDFLSSTSVIWYRCKYMRRRWESMYNFTPDCLSVFREIGSNFTC